MTPSKPSYREIPLSKGQAALVDECDYASLASHKWHARWCKTTRSFYACRKVTTGGRSMQIEMAREILGLVECDGLLADHIESGRTLDNRRANIRIATVAQNNANSRMRSDNTSGYKGVYFDAQRGKYRASVKIGGKRHDAGFYDDPAIAHAAYSELAKKLFGDFARP